MERPEEVTRFLRCGGMNCDRSCENGGKVEDCLTWRVHGYAEELETKVPKWISVKERLPEDYEDVVIIMRDGASSWYRVAYREYGGWSFGGGRRVNDEVTHWMPIPQPPKEE